MTFTTMFTRLFGMLISVLMGKWTLTEEGTASTRAWQEPVKPTVNETSTSWKEPEKPKANTSHRQKVEESFIIRAIKDPSIIKEVFKNQVELVSSLNRDIEKAIQLAAKVSGQLQEQFTKIIGMFQDLRRECLEVVIENRPAVTMSLKYLEEIVRHDPIDRDEVTDIIARASRIKPSMTSIMTMANEIQKEIDATMVKFRPQLEEQHKNAEWDWWKGALMFGGFALALGTCTLMVCASPAACVAVASAGINMQQVISTLALATIAAGVSFADTHFNHPSTLTQMNEVKGTLSRIADRAASIDKVAQQIREQIGCIEFLQHDRYRRRDVENLIDLMKTLKHLLDELEKAANKRISRW